ncbi:MAG: hypothetical protein O2887_14040 [Bacteroidetes bacterium]|nr:hypothetical protein [Bacteroidota bacterium]MDA1121590.1 hypothetical protein [Bacteroidota bacterium]
MDNLEKFVKNRREEFDQDSPSAEVWNRIDKLLETDKKAGSDSPLVWLWKVAAVILFLSTFFLLIDKYQQNELIAETNPELQEFEEIENYYLTQIESRKTMLANYRDEPVVSENFLNDLTSLDSMYVSLKGEIVYSGTNEKILDALVQNLQIKIEILNRQLEILEKLKKQADENVQI